MKKLKRWWRDWQRWWSDWQELKFEFFALIVLITVVVLTGVVVVVGTLNASDEFDPVCDVSNGVGMWRRGSAAVRMTESEFQQWCLEDSS